MPNESADDYQAVRQQFFEELQPEGILETLLVERVINAAWRLRRFGQIEAEILGREFNRIEQGTEKTLGLAFLRMENGTHAIASTATRWPWSGACTGRKRNWAGCRTIGKVVRLPKV